MTVDQFYVVYGDPGRSGKRRSWETPARRVNRASAGPCVGAPTQRYTELARLPFVEVKDRRCNRTLGGATAQTWGGMTLVSRVSGDRERTDYLGEIGPLHLVEPQGGTFNTSAATFEGKGKRIEGWMYDDETAAMAIGMVAMAAGG